ncbi:MAG: sigma-70 family RNA polymerase sigma factor [Candidatus Pacebacteria bacterium]|nr:sigma-70 family RNA polymerase sigma factor [Candidatus Paceibacterota bacterium]
MESKEPKNTPEKPKVTDERSELLAEVFKRYHKDLIKWCIARLNKLTIKGSRISNNLKSDAEEIVADVYKVLLTDKNPIDLNRTDAEIGKFLNIVLDQAVIHYVRKITAQKRFPRGGFVSTEEITEENDEEELLEKLKEYFTQKTDDTIEDGRWPMIKDALVELEKQDKQQVDMIRALYQEGHTLEEIGKSYGFSRENARQRIKRGLNKIKYHIIQYKKPLS